MSQIEFTLPDVGEGLSEAEIIEWSVEVGDPVYADQPLVSVNTDKSVVDIPAPADGTIVTLGGKVGDVLPIGALLAVIEVTHDEDASVEVEARPAPVTAGTHDGQTHRPVVDSPDGSRGAKSAGPRAAPATRKLATQLGVDLSTVDGSGPNGRITSADVRAATEQGSVDTEQSPMPADSPPKLHPTPASQSSSPGPLTEDRIESLRGTRRQIARTMEAAWAVPHITDFREIDAQQLVQAHARLRARMTTTKLTFLPLFVKAAASALRRHPRFNARIDLEAEKVTYRAAINIGIATATDQGLVVPVVTDADRRSIPDVAEEIGRLADAARAGRLEPADTGGGTFTISNFGSYGTWLGTPIIRPPEVAIVGFGRITDRVVAVDGRAVVRPVLPLAAATDHRLNDGADLGAFAATLTELLADPVLLLAES